MLETVRCLIGFHGISTFVGDLMPNPFYTNKQFHFKQFCLALVHSLINKNISIFNYSVWSNSFNSNNSVLFKYSFCSKQFYFKQFSLAYKNNFNFISNNSV